MGSSVPLYFALGWVAEEKHGADTIDWATFATWRSNNHDGPFEELLDRETRMAVEERDRLNLGHAKTRGRPSRDSRVDVRKRDRQSLNAELVDSSSTLNDEKKFFTKEKNKNTTRTLKRGRTEDVDAVPRRNPPRRCSTLMNTLPNLIENPASGEDAEDVAVNIAAIISPRSKNQITNNNRAVERTEKSWGGLFNSTGSPDYHNAHIDSDENQLDGPENVEDTKPGETTATKPEIFLGANPSLPRTEKSWRGLFNPSGSPDHHPANAESEDDQLDVAENVEEEKKGEAPALPPERFMGTKRIVPLTEKSWGGLFNPTGSPDHQTEDADSDYDPPYDTENNEDKKPGEATTFESGISLRATPTLPRTEKSWAGLFNAEGTPEREHNETESEDEETDDKGCNDDKENDDNRKEHNEPANSPNGEQVEDVENDDEEHEVGKQVEYKGDEPFVHNLSPYQ